ncbi:PRAME family member 8 [Cricetulus griseus]|uniref:PRAME family member 8 n=1 Tax=Cricetulus griseus TaxID=10029 RepID=A0A8C2L9B6_CRIGR|nr:PRAME family member 8 [Cricetulus griseus]XP_027243410.1 PRAME family member 8 [Cricetulus griseus]
MSLHTPTPLLKQARQALLRNEELAISAVEQLPIELCPGLLKDAFKGRHTRIVKAMVAAWPFPCLPVGTLMKTPNLETFQAVLEGVDMQLARNFHPRCLRSPLKTLSITGYILSEYDFNYLPCCQRLWWLKHLTISGVELWALNPLPLRLLLETVAHTLQSLDLQGCRMEDSQLTVLIPALSRCTELTNINLYDNDFSAPILKDLLLHTDNWSKINGEQYPAPMECYDDSWCIDTGRFLHLCPELMDALRAKRQAKRIVVATNICRLCGVRCVYDLGPRLCLCWQ